MTAIFKLSGSTNTRQKTATDSSADTQTAATKPCSCDGQPDMQQQALHPTSLELDKPLAHAKTLAPYTCHEVEGVTAMVCLLSTQLHCLAQPQHREPKPATYKVPSPCRRHGHGSRGGQHPCRASPAGDRWLCAKRHLACGDGGADEYTEASDGHYVIKADCDDHCAGDSLLHPQALLL